MSPNPLRPVQNPSRWGGPPAKVITASGAIAGGQATDRALLAAARMAPELCEANAGGSGWVVDQRGERPSLGTTLDRPVPFLLGAYHLDPVKMTNGPCRWSVNLSVPTAR
jgi:hypothetical protein